MIFLIYGILSIIACWIWGDWRNWKSYYSTILYFIIGNLVYVFIFDNNDFWRFPGIFGYPIIVLAGMILAYPSTTILYLTYYPSSPIHKIVYTLIWAVLFTFVELIADLFFNYEYSRGWNLLHSFFLDIGLFTLLRLHFKKPLIVWPFSMGLALAMIWFFRIPLNS